MKSLNIITDKFRKNGKRWGQGHRKALDLNI